MVDVSDKPVRARTATAQGSVILQPSTLEMILDDKVAKGNVFSVARIAGIQAAKRTSELIPLCHPLPLTSVDIGFEHNRYGELTVTATCKANASTGVEMEALTAVSVACLTIYDMTKSVERGSKFGNIHLVSKFGGKSGDWKA